MVNLAIREAEEAPGWEIIDVDISNHNQKRNESDDSLLVPSSFVELQEQWIELAQVHIQRLRKEIEVKERTIERLEVENRVLSMKNNVTSRVNTLAKAGRQDGGAPGAEI
ncbi:hypothetical protein C8J55DRAFT_487587 [Lentinula edodes]|uniref:Uncharacterized protein n=1 Tax=Lentinula lateritia TaxID=40482 RepID=A0A9W9AMM9_9AGAR|nr:hypothetical protein C8J55DRAFT_487587 [Lentinula edodes]